MGGRIGALVLAGMIGLVPPCHPERSEGSRPHASELAGKIPRCARDDRIRRDDTDWARLALEIHNETNLVRRDPVAYAAYLEELLLRFDGKLLERSSRVVLRTEEGADAVREAIEALQHRRPVQELRWSKGLAAAAADHVEDQGPSGSLEHEGTDGSDPAQRAERRGRWRRAMAENIAYGENPARQVVIQLLVDDGVYDRGHRNNILNPQWAVEGVACGPHRDYRQICVMDYAAGYVER